MAGLEVIDFTVEGAGSFPIDMLRFDQAWPRGEDDAGQIHASFNRSGKRRRIRLHSYKDTRAPDYGLTLGRWRSFCWQVVEIEGKPVEPGVRSADA